MPEEIEAAEASLWGEVHFQPGSLPGHFSLSVMGPTGCHLEFL